MKIQLIGKPEKGISGISRYTDDLLKCLALGKIEASLTYSDSLCKRGTLMSWLSKLGIDLRTFFSSYPLRVPLIQADFVHLTSQTLATLILSQQFSVPVVVTVHDIFPFILRKTNGQSVFRHPLEALFFHLSLKGLCKADALIAVSAYTRRTLCDNLKIDPEKVFVAYESVDQQRFHPAEVPVSFYEKYKLTTGRYVLYVGSDDPRKNLETLFRAFAMIKNRSFGLKLLKVGAAQFIKERKRLKDIIAQLNLQEDILFFEQVPDEDLKYFYNLADVFVMPSLYEGFGLPVLEAMACGRPVVVSGSTALPEIVGGAGIILDPIDVESLASQILKILESPSLALSLGTAAYDRAKDFQFSKQVQQMVSIYSKIKSPKS
jgi:glycosyltransferase involved in cell wall biosynthesis